MITLTSKVKKDSYTEFIEQAFDLKVDDVCVTEIPTHLHLENLSDWNIIAICGASGSGKSTILRSFGDIKTPHFDSEKTLISNFDNLSPQEASKLLCAVGLASVPSWLHPYNVLSNGERYRADMAKLLSEAKEGEILLIDEFTSVVDRNVAKAMSNALQKYVREKGIKVILATCHYDILEWLRADYVYDLNKGGALERGDRLRRPSIELACYRCEPNSWRMFAKHHYMTSDMNPSAQCFVFTWDGSMVAFVSVLPMVAKNVENSVRASRIVVLPDYQGLGIGRKCTEFIASIYRAAGYRFYMKTINPRLGEYFNISPNWRGTAYNGKAHNEGNDTRYARRWNRISYCHEYVGEPTFGQGHLIKSVDELRYKKEMKGQLTLF